jgi:predicted acetyltransferase
MDYILEWEATGELIVPYASSRDEKTFEELQTKWKSFEGQEMYEKKLVPATLFFLVEDDGRIIGAADVRHALNDFLLNFGGNIGYGIRPTARQRGYGTIMLKLILETIDINDGVLIVCDDDNIGSGNIIESCGGILENKILENGVLIRRYWINK